ncbi:DUF4097 family beta strand repeat-containing protein [Halalkalibacter suaedae]|uniref:DUF4097 family beta strand repeat protein n=1 Tax=Halalkalibacter suaedae TaxID=2822140 RepID=A0A940WW51_9BACI|nr:DUF4097 family beta strand repeat protein [Bacillus suaedae]
MKVLLGILLIVVGVVIFFWNAPISILTSTKTTDRLVSEDMEGINEINLSSTSVDWVFEDGDENLEVELVNPTDKINVNSLKNNQQLKIEIKEKSRWFSFDFSPSRTKAIVRVPKSYKGKVEITTVSGDIDFKQLNQVTSMKARTVSGDMEAKKLIVKEDYIVNTTSGDLSIDEIDAKVIKAESVSGEMKIEQITGKLDLYSVSGDLLIGLAHENKEMKIKTVSGEVDVMIPSANANLTLKTVSGDLRVSQDMKNQDIQNKRISGMIGKGDYALQISTTSGDIIIR